MQHGFDNTWGIVKNSGLIPSALSPFLYLFAKYLTSSVSSSFFSFFQLASSHRKLTSKRPLFVVC